MESVGEVLDGGDGVEGLTVGADGVDVEKIVELLLEARLVNPSKQESGKPSRAEFISRRLHGENSRTT